MQKTTNLAYFCEFRYTYSDWRNYGVVTDVSLYKFLTDSYISIQNVGIIVWFYTDEKEIKVNAAISQKYSIYARLQRFISKFPIENYTWW